MLFKQEIALPDASTASWRQRRNSLRSAQKARNDLIFVTESPVTFFLIAPILGHFNLFFIRLKHFFVTVLYRMITMQASMR
jgi:hypothetical protein